jgi:hopene-associated glycosyltransferase HpnB
LDADASATESRHDDVTALVPARDEAATVEATVRALIAQGVARVVVIDDQSTDGTATIAQNTGAEIVAGKALPPGWAGKLWALEQGRQVVNTPLTLLVDADIALAPGTVAALVTKQREGFALVSLMAVLEMQTAWEKLLIPAFVYFFKLLYPFRLSNSRNRLVAAAAGGCVLLETAALERIGGFTSFKGAIIDDCALARAIKRSGGRTWLGLTHSALSGRTMHGLQPIWRMVARSAFAQLHYSYALLLVCIAMLALAFWVPILGVFDARTRVASVVALAAMILTYVPTLRFYRRSLAWALALPFAGTLYLLMTVSSAFKQSSWKGREYPSSATRPNLV